MHRPIYLDNHATTPLDERVLATMLPYFTEHFGNPASVTHQYGWEAEAAVKQARQILADAINATPEEIVFTSGATEANNLAIKGVAEAYFSKGRHIITVATEHNAVLDPCAYLQTLGFEITYLPVCGDGLIDLAQLEQAIRPDTILVSVMVANNEIGVIQPAP
ncbi:MAG TPA: aminotransferase class V-fold PLP-dependent enzyme, partial [Phormidium sp.]